jgi:hypothetical protein
MQNRICRNAATIKEAPIEQQVWVAFRAGFCRIGLWLDDIEAAQSRETPLNGIQDGSKRPVW